MYYILGNKTQFNHQQLKVTKKHYKKIMQKIKKIQKLFKQLDKKDMRLNNRSINKPLQKALAVYVNTLETMNLVTK